MCLRPEPIGPIPEETVRVARAAFPKGNLYLRLRDEFGPMYEDSQFADLFPQRGQPAEAPWRLGFLTMVQFIEGLSDRQVAEAVRGRIDLKYLLGLELTDPGFDHSVLSEFRLRLIEGEAEGRLFDIVLTCFKDHGFLRERTRQRTDSTHVLAGVRTLNRLECVGETLRSALEVLAAAAPEWLSDWVGAEGIGPDALDRYGRRIEEFRLPSKDDERKALAETVGIDGWRLLRAVYSSDAPEWLSKVPTIETLRRVWVQQYVMEGETLRWRSGEDLPPSHLLIRSPYDPDARLSQKRTTLWNGYKAHLTETCEPDEVHLITTVQTTPATTADVEITAEIHTDLEEKQLLPDDHLVDTGYVDAELLVQSEADHQVTIVGPVLPDGSWQGQSEAGFDASKFTIDWNAEKATCPNGTSSAYWSVRPDRRGNEEIHIGWAKSECDACPRRSCCTRSKTSGRQLTVRPQAQHEALQANRQQQTTPEWKAAYAARSGIEGTISEGVRAFGLRKCRYVGLAKTRLQHLATAAAMNCVRMAHWLEGRPHASTRSTRFAALLA